MEVKTAKDFNGQSLPDADFSYQNLDRASFYCAYLHKASFRNASLKFADFTDADLRGADFRNADLTGVNFFGADVDGALFSEEGKAHAPKKKFKVEVSRTDYETLMVEAINEDDAAEAAYEILETRAEGWEIDAVLEEKQHYWRTK